jgi:hypothetical protein
MNKVTELAIVEINKAKEVAATNSALQLLRQIEANNACIKQYEVSIKSEQELLAKLGVIPTVKDFMGTEFTGTLNVAQAAIVKGVEVIVKQKADQLVLTGQSVAQRIEQHKGTIAQYEKANAELRKRLMELSVEPATAATLGV